MDQSGRQCTKAFEANVLRKFDEGKNILDKEVTSKNIQTFFQLNSMPLVVEYTHENARDVFGGLIQQHSLLFFSKERSDFKDVLENFREAAAAFRHQVLFTSIDVDDADQERILGFFDLEKDQVPTLRFLKFEHDIALFKPEANSLKAEDIKAFVQGALDGTIKQIRLSQDLPDDWDKHPVKVVVQKNFDEVVFDKTKNVLVEFYAPWCDPYKQLAPIYDELAEKYKDRKDVLIVKVDTMANELEHTKFDSCLTFELYKKETNEVTFSACALLFECGERTLEGLSEFIDTNGEFDQAPPEEVEEKKEEEEEEKEKQKEEANEEKVEEEEENKHGEKRDEL
ncbi:hypothetical protein MTO96_026038 [Rhipicephalus appendiculatus]